MGFSYPEADRIAKMIPFELGINAEAGAGDRADLKKLCADDPRVRMIDTQWRWRLTCHASTHAAGVVTPMGISPTRSPFKTSRTRSPPAT